LRGKWKRKEEERRKKRKEGGNLEGKKEIRKPEKRYRGKSSGVTRGVTKRHG